MSESIDEDELERLASEEFFKQTHVIDRNDFIDGYKAGYRKAWEQLT
jgi:hypothetical protein